MDNWLADLSISTPHSTEPKPARASGPLQAVSGNRQTYALDCHDGPENQRPPDLYQINSQSESNKYHSNTFTASAPLGSNDAAVTLTRAQQRQPPKHRGKAIPLNPKYRDRSYLTSKKYLDYRDRQRKDLGPDNKQVWSDAVEEAFQEALIEIEPMGKTRRPQHKRPHGRNELIAEYIYRRTGEKRSRKQVSSHIQVLKNLLRDLPSWRKITELPKGPESHAANKGFYENSIAHRVEQRQSYLAAQRSGYAEDDYGIPSGSLPLPSQTLGSNAFPTAGNRITGINFEMWMSPNHANMEKRLHDFTSLQSDRDLPRCNPTPLEHLANWRSSYPCVAAALESRKGSPKCDILMVETSYKVMTDFPPPRATLGLRLELDYETSCEKFFDWTCTTTIYSHGVPVQPPSHYRLEAKHGMIKPTFESKWWASTFIDSIEQRKQAEEASQHNIYQTVRDRVQDYFSSLTAVHEIRARSPFNGGSEPKSERGLVAVLLWKFSVAPDTYVGTTSWHRLVQPPSRITTNSPTPSQQQMALPPLVMDSLLDSMPPPRGMDIDNEIFQNQDDEIYHDYDPDLGDEHIMDFDMTFRDEDTANFGSIQSSFMAAGTDGQEFHPLNPLEYDMGLQDLSGPSNPQVYPHASNNLFDEPHNGNHDNRIDQQRNHHAQDQIFGLHKHFDDDESKEEERQPLTNFDRSTHNLLQAQLTDTEPLPVKAEESSADEALRAALAAASAMSDLGSTGAGTRPPHGPSQPVVQSSDPTAALWEDMSLQCPTFHQDPQTYCPNHDSCSPTLPATDLHNDHNITATTASESTSAVNTNAFDTNQDVTPCMELEIEIDIGGGTPHAHNDDFDHHPLPSSPEIRRLLNIHSASLPEPIDRIQDGGQYVEQGESGADEGIHDLQHDHVQDHVHGHGHGHGLDEVQDGEADHGLHHLLASEARIVDGDGFDSAMGFPSDSGEGFHGIETGGGAVGGDGHGHGHGTSG